METKVLRVLTQEQLQAVLASGLDIGLNTVVIYDLRAETSYRLLDANDNALSVEGVVLDSEQVIVSDVDGDIQAQVTSEAIRLMLDVLGADDRASKVEITVNTALTPDFETSSLDEEVTAAALREEFKKRDLQDLAAVNTGTLPRDSVGTDALQDASVTAAKLASGAITSDKISANAVNALHIAPNAVSTEKLGTGAITSAQLADNAVTGAKLSDNSITLDKLAPDARSAVGVSAVLPSGSITGDKIAAGAVGTRELGSGVVDHRKIASGAVTSSKLATGAVTGSKVAPRSLSLDHFADGPAGLIADGSVGAEALKEKSVTRDKLQDGLLAEPTISGSDELSGLDVVILGGGLTVGQPCGVFSNSAGDLQAVALTTAALTAALGTLPAGATPASYMYGIVRQLVGNGLVSVAVVPGAFVTGFTGLTPGAFYKPNTAGTAFERTTVPNEAKAVALDATTLKLLANIRVS